MTAKIESEGEREGRGRGRGRGQEDRSSKRRQNSVCYMEKVASKLRVAKFYKIFKCKSLEIENNS